MIYKTFALIWSILNKATPCCSGECDAITKRCSPLIPPNCYLPTEFVAKTPPFNIQDTIFSVSSPLKFDVTILSASISSVYVPNKDLKGCAMEGTHWATFLVTKIKVSNIGQTNYVVPAQQLEQTDCDTISSFMSMYSVDFPGGPYYKYERCLSDTTEPKFFTCLNMGLSAGNFHTTTLWIEISDTVATSLTTAGEVVTANFLPLDLELKSSSSPYPVTIMTVPFTVWTTTPSTGPSLEPTTTPSTGPSLIPTTLPSKGPSLKPTTTPSTGPSLDPTTTPSTGPSLIPTTTPSTGTSLNPSINPTSAKPTAVPSIGRTIVPSTPSLAPTVRQDSFSTSYY